MNRVHVSIYVCLLQFLSSTSYNFPSAGLLFFVSLSDSSLLMYKNATDFWVFILYPATLLNSFIGNSSLVQGGGEYSFHLLCHHLGSFQEYVLICTFPGFTSEPLNPNLLGTGLKNMLFKLTCQMPFRITKFENYC